MMKKLSCLLLSLALILCALAAQAEPIKLVDQTGRAVTLEAPAQRIVSGYYISTSACIALGLADRMVAIEAKADTRNIYKLAAPELLALPNVGTAKAFDLEACLAAEPELVILPRRLKDAADALAEFGIPALLVDPEDAGRLNEMILLIGEATPEASGEPRRAKDLVDFIEGHLQDLAATLSPQEVAPVTALLLGNSDRMTCAPGDMYQSAVLAQAGAVNAAQELTGGDFAAISYEQLLAWNPQAIVVPPEAAYTVDDVLSDPELAALAAVQSGAVYQMPRGFEAWDSPVPTGVLGTLWLASTLHPDVYPRELYVLAANDLYETFYGFTPDEAAL